ncbi:MAG: fused MFS/spermidine synthase [Deltaproteobacteria bacterium]|nr:fused MFS/spermidine synthase [Deltaproteobacteria bacterium]
MLFALFFVSGFAGLLYEVCWVRGFGNEFGNTVHSASLVTAVFMAGLGFGSHRAGAWADRRRGSPRTLLHAYAGAELAIALLGLGLAIALPRLGGLSVALSSYERGANGWHALSLGSNVLRYAIAAALLAPPSFLMGTTLTLLVRAVVGDDVSRAGLRIGLLYGANTAGAALGAYACDAWLVPRIGIAETQSVAAAANVLVGGGAILLARSAVSSPAMASSPASEPTSAAGGGRVVAAASLALGLSGFAALGMEIVWFRFLATTLGAYRAVFSMVLTAVLVGICLGSALGGWCERRFGRPLELFAGAQALFASSALLLMATFTPSAPAKSVIVVVGLPSLLMGFSFPLVNAHVQDAVAAVGRRTGALYLANTAGSVLGSLVAGFVLTSWAGSQTSFLVLAVVAAIAPLPLVIVATPTKALKTAATGSLAAAMIAFAAFASLPSDHLIRRFIKALPPAERILASYEGPEGSIHVIDNKPESRILFTNGHPMSGTSLNAQRYMRAFAHLPLLMNAKPERALVICFGVGSTLNATSLHPLDRFELADISRGVLSHASWFRDNNHDVLADPRLSVFVQDGRQHLRQQPPGVYDLVTLEPPPIEFAGVSALYSREFYELARTRLKPNGIMTQWLPAYAVTREAGLAMVRAFVDVFPSSVLLSGSGPELILMGTPASELVFDLDRVEASLRERPAVAADLARVRMGTLTEMAGSFVSSAAHLRRATENVAPVTDDRPVMEYTWGLPNELSPLLFGGTGDAPGFCPKCFEGGKPTARVASLGVHLSALEKVYQTARFRKNETGSLVVALTPEETRVARESPYLTALLGGDPRPHFARAFSLAQRGDLAGAEAELRAGLAILPTDPDARYNLAVLLASTGREDAAVEEAKKVLEHAKGEHPRASAMLCSMRGIECAK